MLQNNVSTMQNMVCNQANHKSINRSYQLSLFMLPPDTYIYIFISLNVSAKLWGILEVRKKLIFLLEQQKNCNYKIYIHTCHSIRDSFTSHLRQKIANFPKLLESCHGSNMPFANKNIF